MIDTIDWLLKNINGNNGKVGMTGISSPGFYATAALPNAHPALKAVSPQAPVTDEFEGDDVYHRGAFFLLDNVDCPSNKIIQCLLFQLYFAGLSPVTITVFTPTFLKRSN